jgi:hypothetical protein
LVLRTHPDSQSTIGGETSGNIAVFMMELVCYKHTQDEKKRNVRFQNEKQQE